MKTSLDDGTDLSPSMFNTPEGAEIEEVPFLLQTF